MNQGRQQPASSNRHPARAVMVEVRTKTLSAKALEEQLKPRRGTPEARTAPECPRAISPSPSHRRGFLDFRKATLAGELNPIPVLVVYERLAAKSL